MTAASGRYPCPCCGHLVFGEPPGSGDICLICFWEDDADQLRWPHLGEGTNVLSLREAQQNFLKFGAIEERFVGDVRAPTPEEPREPEWRPIHASDSFEPSEDGTPAPSDPTRLYYWRRTFWRSALRSN